MCVGVLVCVCILVRWCVCVSNNGKLSVQYRTFFAISAAYKVLLTGETRHDMSTNPTFVYFIVSVSRDWSINSCICLLYR
jgi:hypothetical protein